jgi:DNA-binding MarR family transcriptional regulator/GNAT superfamily N-acetyltransferase
MAHQVPAARVAEVRAFNRFFTNAIGVLREGLLGSPYSLTEARVLFELAQRRDTEIAELRRALDIDAGYLSRLLGQFAADGLITKTRSSVDARRQVVRLTRHGRRAFARLDARSTAQVEALLGRLTEENQRRLVTAMTVIQATLQQRSPPEVYVIRPPRSGDWGWIIHRHGTVYADEYGWDESFEALVARIVADYIDHRDSRREAAWIADIDGEPVGSVLCVRRDDHTAQLRLLLVDPDARGLGIGTRLVHECLRFATRAGYQQLVLWTNDVLHDARRIYQRAGFHLVAEEKHHSFGHDLVGQHWAIDLTSRRR